MGTCDNAHWNDNITANVQSGPTPSNNPNDGGEVWTPLAELLVKKMPGSPATGNRPLRVLIANRSIPIDQPDAHAYSPSEFNVEVDLHNPDTNNVEQVVAGPEEFNLPTTGTREMVVYTIGDSALKLTGELDPGSDGGWQHIGAQAPFGMFTLTCVKAEKE